MILTVDNGYWDVNAIIAAKEYNITILIPSRIEAMRTKQKINEKEYSEFHKINFKFDYENNYFICPMGEKLTCKSTYEKKGLKYGRYTSDKCKECPMHYYCTTQTTMKFI